MPTPSLLIRVFAAAAFLAMLFLNAGSARCESNRPEAWGDSQSQARKMDRRAELSRQDNGEDDRSQNFKILEYIILQNIQRNYQRLERREDLDDLLD